MLTRGTPTWLLLEAYNFRFRFSRSPRWALFRNGFGIALVLPLELALLEVSRTNSSRRGSIADRSPLSVQGGIGGLILNPLSQALLDQLGYPWTYRILGFISGGVALLGAMFLRTFGTPKPRKGGLRNLVDFSNFKDFTFTRLYIMAICSGMGYFVPYAFTVPFATSIGVPASTGSGMAAVTNAFGAIGRIGVGLISDRVGSMNCWAVAFLLGALSILVIWTNAYTPGVLWFFAVVWGAASGAYVRWVSSRGPKVCLILP